MGIHVNENIESQASIGNRVRISRHTHSSRFIDM